MQGFVLCIFYPDSKLCSVAGGQALSVGPTFMAGLFIPFIGLSITACLLYGYNLIRQNKFERTHSNFNTCGKTIRIVYL